HAGALGRREDAAVDVYALPLSKALIGKEKERAIAHDGSAERRAELVPVERRLGGGWGVERVARVEPIVAVELERFAGELIGPGPRRDVDDGAGVSAVLGAE